MFFNRRCSTLSPRRVPAAHLGAAQLRPERLGLAEPAAVGPAPSLQPARLGPTPPDLELDSSRPAGDRAALQQPHRQRAEALGRAAEQSLEPDLPRYGRTV